MTGADDVLAAISSAIDDVGVSPDAMRSGPHVEPDPADQPLIVVLLLVAGGHLDAGRLHVAAHQLVRAEAIVAALIGRLGPLG